MSGFFKFRAWDKNNKKIIDVHTIDFENGNINACDGDNYDDILLGFDSILIEYTRLKDKKGVEIYEGYIGWDSHYECYGVVKFEEGKFVYEWDNICEDLCEVNKDMEITGNVFEHSHLLEGEN